MKLLFKSLFGVLLLDMVTGDEGGFDGTVFIHVFE